MRPKVRRNYIESYEYSLKSEFVDTVIRQIESIKGKIKAVRIHDSGDFYSQEYVDKWVTIVKRFPNLKFFALTKRATDFDFSELKSLPNFYLIDSLKFGRLNYGHLDDILRLAKKYDAYVCPATLPGNNHKITCGNGCNYCMTKWGEKKGILFVQHS